MGRLIVSIALLAVMSAGCAAAVWAVQRCTDDMSSLVSQVEDAFVAGDTEASVNAANELSDRWQSFMKYGVLVNDLGHAVEITSSIAEIGSFAQESNEELYAACDRAQAQIGLFKAMQVPSFWKIL